jgi:disulfide bond formation protein DsbB
MTGNRARALTLAAGALVVAAVVACGGAAQPAAPATSKPAGQPTAAAKAGDATRGKQIFTQSCSACHGQDAKGMPGLGKDMTTSAFIKAQSDAQLLDFVKKGRPVSDPANTTKVDMPPKGGNPALTDAQLLDIIAFMRSVQQ